MAMNAWQAAYPTFASLYQPGSYGGLYGAPGTNTAFETTPFGQSYLEDTPEAAFFRKAQGAGYGGLDRRSQLAQSLYGKAQLGYKAALADNPFMGWQAGEGNYLDRLSFEDLLRQMTPQQRGEGLPNFQQSSKWMTR